MRSKLGHIKRLGHNHYHVFWEKGRRADGTRNRHSKRLHCTRQEAEQFLARQIGLEDLPANEVTWFRFWAAYVEPTFDGLQKRTIDDYQKLWSKYLAPSIGNTLVSDTDELLVDSVLAGLAPSTQRHVKDVWRKACNIAVRRRLLGRCPIDSNTPLKPLRHRQKRLLDASEVFPWLEGLRGYKGELCFLAMLGGGLRPEEAYGLRYEDIQFIDGYAIVSVKRALTYSNGKVLKEPKTGEQRETVIGSPFAEMMATIVTGGDGVIMASGKTGLPAEEYTSPSTVCRNYRGWCERHNMPYVPPKNLRASYATLHGEAGSPDSLVSGSMGHSDGTTRGRHYQAITRRGLMLIADNLAEYLLTFKVDNSVEN